VCELDGVDVVSLVATAGEPDTMVELEVTLANDAPAAGACIAEGEPDQIFFAESTVAARVHHLRLSGLLPDASYTCTAAPTCPARLGAPASTTWQTSSPPADVPPFNVMIDPTLGMTGVWTLAPTARGLAASQAWIAIWGADGRPRWWTPLPVGVRMSVEALYDAADGTIVWGGGKSPEGRIRVHHLWDGELYAWAPEGWEEIVFHHDGKRLADGRLLTLENRINSANGDIWEGFRIRVHDPVTGRVDFDFDSQTFVDQGILHTPGIDNNDAYHANWVDWHESAEGPRVYVSLCSAEQILAIDASTGGLAWLLGKHLGWRVLDAAGHALPDSALPDCQHGLDVISDDHFLVYDNGQNTPSSHAQEWLVDPVTRTAQRIWNWTEDGWSQWWLGDVDDLGYGRVLVTEAPGPVVEVDKATGRVASRFALTGDGETYRAERYDGCALFTSVKECPDLAERYERVRPWLE